MGSHFPTVRRCESDMKWSVNSQKNGMKANAFFGQDERCRGIKEFCGRSEGTDVLENGRTYHCSDLPGRTSFKAVTVETGEVGEVITNNAKVFKNVPLQISYQGELILRGEAVDRL